MFIYSGREGLLDRLFALNYGTTTVMTAGRTCPMAQTWCTTVCTFGHVWSR